MPHYPSQPPAGYPGAPSSPPPSGPPLPGQGAVTPPYSQPAYAPPDQPLPPQLAPDHRSPGTGLPLTGHDTGGPYEWDLDWPTTAARRSAYHKSADGSPVVIIVAAVLAVLVVAVVAWVTLSGDDGPAPSEQKSSSEVTTPLASPSLPIPGEARPMADGWLTYRTPDGAWLFELPAAPTMPTPLPSNSTLQIAYAKTASGRVGFGWSSAQLSPATDEVATLVEIMRGIAASRGAANFTPQVVGAGADAVVTATLDLDGGKALFVLRSLDRRPVVAMAVAGIGEPDPGITTRMIATFKAAS